MIRNLRDTTQKNTEQDWLKTNLAKFSRMLQGQRDLTNVGRMVLSELCPVVTARQAEFYVLRFRQRRRRNSSCWPATPPKARTQHGQRINLGQGLIGQCASTKKESCSPRCRPITSASPRASAKRRRAAFSCCRSFSKAKSAAYWSWPRSKASIPSHQAFLDQLTESIGIVLNTIEANMRTEDLLKQSQSLAQQLQTRQEELQKTNEELQEKAHLLARQNEEVERKNAEVEQARQELEEKATPAGPHFQVQIRVPGEHVARAANAAQQPAHSFRSASEKPEAAEVLMELPGRAATEARSLFVMAGSPAVVFIRPRNIPETRFFQAGMNASRRRSD